MEYNGKLYGKIGNKYFDTDKTSEDYDNLLNALIEINKLCADASNVQDGKLNIGQIAKLSIIAINKQC